MSEFQNKAVRLTAACDGTAAAGDIVERRKKFLGAALELNQALEAAVIAGKSLPVGENTIRSPDLIIGDLMKELAVIGHLLDIDVMQAGHNTLDRRMREIRKAFKAASVRTRQSA
ncbi:hypothetical protein [Ensifer sp. 22564]|uniref:hypothetical protein n=1 Tax=unclassified Ensifer TaxID=2633371 RepID=UPI003F82FE1B